MSSNDRLQATSDLVNTRNADDSDGDPSYQAGQPVTPRARSTAGADLTTPPQNILNQPGTASDEAKARLTERSPHNKKCSVTFLESLPECSHILPRSTQLRQVRTLEYAWGKRFNSLNLDSTQNMMWLSPHMHSYFDRRIWVLLPPKSDLEKVKSTTIEQFSLAKKTDFTSVLHRDIRKYDFVLLAHFTDPIVRVENINQASTHWPPYDSLSPVRSHVHPYFVICNVGLKDRYFYPELTPSLLAARYPNITAEHSERIQLCRSIYDLWMAQSDVAETAWSKTKSTKSKSRQSSAHSSTSQRSNPSRHAKRKREDKDDNHLRTIGEDYSSAQDLPSSPCDASPSSCTTESSDSEDELDSCVGWDSSVEEPYWNKVGNWIKDMETSEPHSSLFQGGVTVLDV
ncbi:unnamed protein product [Rhizoctonia solani]|uniref:HNH nuclease domain-containing protein n=1 Tax=Rhizoctonia solani TaxID=456999 RepID=A0A8H3BXI7_9AGAM|nr:unnamed protein product [Rhizoctonia solani]